MTRFRKNLQRSFKVAFDAHSLVITNPTSDDRDLVDFVYIGEAEDTEALYDCEQTLAEFKKAGIIKDYEIVYEWKPLATLRLEAMTPLQLEIHREEILERKMEEFEGERPVDDASDGYYNYAKITFSLRNFDKKYAELIAFPVQIKKKLKLEGAYLVIDDSIPVSMGSERGKGDEGKDFKVFKELMERWDIKTSGKKSGSTEPIGVKILQEESGIVSPEAVWAAVDRLKKKISKERLPIKLDISKKKKTVQMTVTFTKV